MVERRNIYLALLAACLAIEVSSVAEACPPASSNTVAYGMMMLTAEAQLEKPVCGGIVNTLRVEIKSAIDHRVLATVPETGAGTSTGVNYLMQIAVDEDLANGPYVTSDTIITFDSMGRWEKKADLCEFPIF